MSIKKGIITYGSYKYPTMFEKPVKTEFLSAERVDQSQIKEQYDLLSENKLLKDIVESVSQMLVILNKERQIIYANKSFLRYCSLPNIERVMGKRPGEVLNCECAYLTKLGCGTTEFCRNCGAAKAILESGNGEQATKICEITTRNNENLNLMVTATPFEYAEQSFTIFVVKDISNKKRREELERVFFHDILNNAGGIAGLSEILLETNESCEKSEITKAINQAAINLVEEIRRQQQLSYAEQGLLKPEFKELSSLALLNDLKKLYNSHKLIDDKLIIIANNSDDVKLISDPVLLRRIIGNMIINALDACSPKAIVTLCSTVGNKSILFSVHCDSYIEPDIQSNIFKRSFSTKGIGRGLGTYSMKLFGEKYLKGKVWFETSKEKGTTFFIEI